jgi:hypothetical protein
MAGHEVIMLLADDRRYAGLKHHAKVQSFRLVTVLFAWGLLALTFLYSPEWIRTGMRAGTRAIEAVGDALPGYWGAQAEIVLRAGWLSVDTNYSGHPSGSHGVLAYRGGSSQVIS